MNNFDVAGLLRTYSELSVNAKTTEQLKEIVYALKGKLDCRKMRIEKQEEGNDGMD